MLALGAWIGARRQAGRTPGAPARLASGLAGNAALVFAALTLLQSFTVVLVPQFRSVARGVTASYDARALYTSERELLALTILKELQAIVEPRGITVESTPLRKVGLPSGLTASIEEKLRAEQESQRMQFVLLKEKQEAERKRIEATEKIAASPNTKVVIIGAGKDGLPLILDTK
ncbi:MAG TPA: SPFH domain-containing protein [Thermoanaerobaculia bacterium]|nr:SPFH domain-containing protein [Thermoanaerobaculia bacterium]